ncbi:MAG: HlyD family efflux transporter periplasmic adaptor subunit [Oscillibacter sp.]|nr:HlyD family efflux transporter periplasmic adaptor subunit [Oscillibacter sp.]
MPLYSEEVQDIMGRIPGRILRLGLTVIFGVMLLLLCGCYFFQYPEVVSCPVRLTTLNPPQELYARTTGMIERMEVKENDIVHPGQLIAVLKNTADYDDVCRLEEMLDKLGGVVAWDSVVVREELSPELQVGELQAGYVQLYKAWIGFKHYCEQNYLPIKIELQRRQVDKQREDYRELQKQQELRRQDLELALRQFRRDSLFYHRYQDAVSAVEYEKQMQGCLQKKTAYMDFCTTVRNAGHEVLKQENVLVDLRIQYEQELDKYRQAFDEAYRLLVESHNQWKGKYVLESHTEGTVTLAGYWSEKQVVNSGDKMATIVPKDTVQIVGRAVIDMSGIGKVEKGQRVNIKLNSFPYMEYGMLRGIVNNVSLVANHEKGYIAEILLTEGMQSSYKEQLRFIQDVEGVAEIITKEERLLSKLLRPLKSKMTE